MRRQRVPRVVLAVTAAVVAVLLAGCGGGSGSTSNAGSTASTTATPETGGTLRLAQAHEVVSLDPRQGIDGSSLHVFTEIMQTLFESGPEGKVVPLLAQSSKLSADHLTWTFPIRQGVTFSNGQPLTAADVVFSLELAAKSPYFVLFGEKIKSIQASSPTTVTIVTKEPVPALLSMLAVPVTSVVPKNYDGVSEKEFARHPIGTGPFTLASWKQGQEIVLQRNPRYWEAGKPYLSRVVFVTTGDDNARIARLKSGELDAAEAPPFSSLPTLEQLPEVEVAESEPTISNFVVLNTRNPLFKNPDVRKAVSLAIDRKGVLQAALDGHGMIGGSYFPPVLLYADESISAPAQNMAEAKSLLADAVREDGVNPAFTLLISSGETLQSNTAQIIQQNLEEAGFSVQIQPLDLASFLEQLENGNFDGAVSGAYSTVSDPIELVNYYVGEEGLYTGALTKAEEQSVAEAETQFDSQKRQNAYYAFQESVAAANAVIQLNYQPFVWALNNNVVGFKVQASGNLSLREVGFAK